MSAGCNDHPSTPTALQVYRILTLCNVLMPKPSKYGNCTNDPSDPKVPSIVSLRDIKKIYKKSNEKSEKTPYEQLIKKIDIVVNSNTEEINVCDIINLEHDYQTTVQDFEKTSILYYSAAKICKRLCETNPVKDCDVCKKALLKATPVDLDSQLLGLEESEIKYQPNEIFFNMLTKLNSIFDLNKDKVNVAEQVIHEAAKQRIFSFSCANHNREVIEFTIESFISTKMLQIAAEITRKKKKSMQLKKLAKLTGS